MIKNYAIKKMEVKMCNQAEKDIRINRTMKLLMDNPSHKVKEKLMAEFGIESRTCDNYIAWAKDELRKAFAEDRYDHASLVYSQLMDIYYNSEKPADKIKALEVVMKIMGFGHDRSPKQAYDFDADMNRLKRKYVVSYYGGQHALEELKNIYVATHEEYKKAYSEDCFDRDLEAFEVGDLDDSQPDYEYAPERKPNDVE
jgi:hypothetical protein